MPLGPARKALPAEFRAPAETAGKRRNDLFEHSARPGFRTEVIDQDELAARTRHAGELVEGALRVLYRGDDELSHHCIEIGIAEAEVLGIHDGERLDVCELVFAHALLRDVVAGLFAEEPHR